MPKVKSQIGIEIVKAYVQVWKDYAMIVKLLDRLFDYVSRFYIRLHIKPTLGAAALQIFNTIFYNEVKDIYLAEVLLNLSRYREGHQIEAALIKDAV